MDCPRILSFPSTGASRALMTSFTLSLEPLLDASPSLKGGYARSPTNTLSRGISSPSQSERVCAPVKGLSLAASALCLPSATAVGSALWLAFPVLFMQPYEHLSWGPFHKLKAHLPGEHSSVNHSSAAKVTVCPLTEHPQW